MPFDRFGLMNTMKPGNSLTLHLDDLAYDGKVEDFSRDPGWVGVNNDFTAANRQLSDNLKVEQTIILDNRKTMAALTLALYKAKEALESLCDFVVRRTA